MDRYYKNSFKKQPQVHKSKSVQNKNEEVDSAKESLNKFTSQYKLQEVQIVIKKIKLLDDTVNLRDYEASLKLKKLTKCFQDIAGNTSKLEVSSERDRNKSNPKESPPKITELSNSSPILNNNLSLNDDSISTTFQTNQSFILPNKKRKTRSTTHSENSKLMLQKIPSLQKKNLDTLETIPNLNLQTEKTEARLIVDEKSTIFSHGVTNNNKLTAEYTLQNQSNISRKASSCSPRNITKVLKKPTFIPKVEKKTSHKSYRASEVLKTPAAVEAKTLVLSSKCNGNNEQDVTSSNEIDIPENKSSENNKLSTPFKSRRLNKIPAQSDREFDETSSYNNHNLDKISLSGCNNLETSKKLTEETESFTTSEAATKKKSLKLKKGKNALFSRGSILNEKVPTAESENEKTGLINDFENVSLNDESLRPKKRKKLSVDPSFTLEEPDNLKKQSETETSYMNNLNKNPLLVIRKKKGNGIKKRQSRSSIYSKMKLRKKLDRTTNKIVENPACRSELYSLNRNLDTLHSSLKKTHLKYIKKLNNGSRKVTSKRNLNKAARNSKKKNYMETSNRELRNQKMFSMNSTIETTVTPNSISGVQDLTSASIGDDLLLTTEVPRTMRRTKVSNNVSSSPTINDNGGHFSPSQSSIEVFIPIVQTPRSSRRLSKEYDHEENTGTSMPFKYDAERILTKQQTHDASMMETESKATKRNSSNINKFLRSRKCSGNEGVKNMNTDLNTHFVNIADSNEPHLFDSERNFSLLDSAGKSSAESENTETGNNSVPTKFNRKKKSHEWKIKIKNENKETELKNSSRSEVEEHDGISPLRSNIFENAEIFSKNLNSYRTSDIAADSSNVGNKENNLYSNGPITSKSDTEHDKCNLLPDIFHVIKESSNNQKIETKDNNVMEIKNIYGNGKSTDTIDSEEQISASNIQDERMQPYRTDLESLSPKSRKFVEADNDCKLDPNNAMDISLSDQSKEQSKLAAINEFNKESLGNSKGGTITNEVNYKKADSSKSSFSLVNRIGALKDGTTKMKFHSTENLKNACSQKLHIAPNILKAIKSVKLNSMPAQKAKMANYILEQLTFAQCPIRVKNVMGPDPSVSLSKLVKAKSESDLSLLDYNLPLEINSAKRWSEELPTKYATDSSLYTDKEIGDHIFKIPVNTAPNARKKTSAFTSTFLKPELNESNVTQRINSTLRTRAKNTKLFFSGSHSRKGTSSSYKNEKKISLFNKSSSEQTEEKKFKAKNKKVDREVLLCTNNESIPFKVGTAVECEPSKLHGLEEKGTRHHNLRPSSHSSNCEVSVSNIPSFCQAGDGIADERTKRYSLRSIEYKGSSLKNAKNLAEIKSTNEMKNVNFHLMNQTSDQEEKSLPFLSVKSPNENKFIVDENQSINSYLPVPKFHSKEAANLKANIKTCSSWNSSNNTPESSGIIDNSDAHNLLTSTKTNYSMPISSSLSPTDLESSNHSTSAISFSNLKCSSNITNPNKISRQAEFVNTSTRRRNCPLSDNQKTFGSKKSKKNAKTVSKNNLIQNQSLNSKDTELKSSTNNSAKNILDKSYTSRLRSATNHKTLQQSCETVTCSKSNDTFKKQTETISSETKNHTTNETQKKTTYAKTLMTAQENSVNRIALAEQVCEFVSQFRKLDSTTADALNNCKKNINNEEVNQELKAMIPREGLSRKSYPDRPPEWFLKFIATFRKQELWRLHQMFKIHDHLMRVESAKLNVLEQVYEELKGSERIASDRT